MKVEDTARQMPLPTGPTSTLKVQLEKTDGSDSESFGFPSVRENNSDDEVDGTDDVKSVTSASMKPTVR